MLDSLVVAKCIEFSHHFGVHLACSFCKDSQRAWCLWYAIVPPTLLMSSRIKPLSRQAEGRCSPHRARRLLDPFIL